MAKSFNAELGMSINALGAYIPTWQGATEYREYLHFEDAVVTLNVKAHDGGTYLVIESVTSKAREDNERISDNPSSTGFLDRFLNAAADLAIDLGYDGLYVDTIINEWLPAALARRGYIPDHTSRHPDINVFLPFYY